MKLIFAISIAIVGTVTLISNIESSIMVGLGIFLISFGSSLFATLVERNKE